MGAEEVVDMSSDVLPRSLVSIRRKAEAATWAALTEALGL